MCSLGLLSLYSVCLSEYLHILFFSFWRVSAGIEPVPSHTRGKHYITELQLTLDCSSLSDLYVLAAFCLLFLRHYTLYTFACVLYSLVHFWNSLHLFLISLGFDNDEVSILLIMTILKR